MHKEAQRCTKMLATNIALWDKNFFSWITMGKITFNSIVLVSFLFIIEILLLYKIPVQVYMLTLWNTTYKEGWYMKINYIFSGTLPVKLEYILINWDSKWQPNLPKIASPQLFENVSHITNFTHKKHSMKIFWAKQIRVLLNWDICKHRFGG